MHCQSLALLLPFVLAVSAQGPICDHKGKFQSKQYVIARDRDLPEAECLRRCADSTICKSVSYDSDDECEYYPASMSTKSFIDKPDGDFRVWDRTCSAVQDTVAPNTLCSVTLKPRVGIVVGPECESPAISELETILQTHSQFATNEHIPAKWCAAPGHTHDTKEISKNEVANEIACATYCLLNDKCLSYYIEIKQDKNICKTFAGSLESYRFEEDGDAGHIYYDRDCEVTSLFRNAHPRAGQPQPSPPRRPEPVRICKAHGTPEPGPFAFRAQIDYPSMTDSMNEDNCRDSCMRNSTCQAYGYAETDPDPTFHTAFCAHTPGSLQSMGFKVNNTIDIVWSDRQCWK